MQQKTSRGGIALPNIILYYHAALLQYSAVVE